MFTPIKRVLAVSFVLIICVLIAACGGQSATPAKAPEVKKIEYPTKAVQVIHGFKPGGGSDQLAQLVQPYLEKILKVQFGNVYKTGADGAIAWKEVGKNSKPDGYTLTTVLTPKTQLNSFINKDVGYVMEDFEPIANVVFDPGVFVVGPDSPFKTMQEFMDYAKKNPGKARVSNSGTGGDDWFNAVMIEKLGGAKFNNIPFEGDGPAWQAAAGGHVDANTNNISTIIPLIQGKKLRALAVYTEKRLPALPDVPTLKELGIDLVEGSYRGYLAPKGTPKEIIDILANAIEKVTKDPEFLKSAKAVSLEIVFKKGEDNKKFLNDEKAALKKIVDELGIKQ